MMGVSSNVVVAELHGSFDLLNFAACKLWLQHDHHLLTGFHVIIISLATRLARALDALLGHVITGPSKVAAGKPKLGRLEGNVLKLIGLMLVVRAKLGDIFPEYLRVCLTYEMDLRRHSIVCLPSLLALKFLP